MHVDLSLAVNYIPACACLTKVLIFMLAANAVPANLEVDALFIMAGILYMDRLVTRNIIFDANAILLAIFFANVHAGVRAYSTRRAYPFLVDAMFLFWACGSVVLLFDPRSVRAELDKRPWAARLVPVVLMIIIVVAIAHVYGPLETGGIRCCRAVAFALLSFAWIYIVGVHAPAGIEYLKENSCQFVSRLSPVLYASPWIAGAFTVGAVSAFITIHMRSSPAGSPAGRPSGGYHSLLLPTPLAPLPDTNTSTTTPRGKEEEADGENIEELFRLAQKQQAARKAGVGFAMNSIPEISSV
jgi:hypothetical protein